MTLAFWLNQVIVLNVLGLVSYSGGRLVRDKRVKVNYTRKINHFTLFFAPLFIDAVFFFEPSYHTTIARLVLTCLAFGCYVEPIRARVPVVRTMFLSFDRPEDRPHTLLWFYTQTLAALLIMIPMIIFFTVQGFRELLYVPVLINGIGDGLAEPVGVYFGKHKYPARALFTDKTYVRSLEGSACVFITSVLTVCVFYASFSPAQFVVVLLSLPVLMTLAEAFAPHTWDTPFLYTVCGLTLAGTMLFVA